MTSTLLTQLKTATSWSIALGILMVIIGAFAITLPLATGLAVISWLGWIYTFIGILNLIYTWQSRSDDRITLILNLLVAFLYLGTGIFLIANPMKGVVTLTLILAVFLLVEGIFELVLAFKVRSLSPNWGWVLGHAILTITLSLLIWLRLPSSATWVIGLLVGINIISSGISRIMISLTARLVLTSQTYRS